MFIRKEAHRVAAKDSKAESWRTTPYQPWADDQARQLKCIAKYEDLV